MKDDKLAFDVVLTGCRPEPLASYLKALGVLRLVAEQVDPDAAGWWQGEHFVLRSTLDYDGLLAFFADDWRPTPVIAPWNGGSGFYPNDNREAADAIVASRETRLGPFRRAIQVGRDFVDAQGWKERPTDAAKAFMLASMRALLPDESLAWLDAAIVLGDDRPLFPPLLGTGGNDGRLDFSNNYQQRVVEALASRDVRSLASALFAIPITSRFKGTMGQYSPAASERTNPWDFVLLIEGAMLFAAAATRRYESRGRAVLAFPFHAHAAGGIGTVVPSDEDESRNEVWLPMWSAPASLRGLRRLFAEGRATVGSNDRAHAAATALDFARAVTSLGVDRGIDTFTRVGFQLRNGRSYFATPLGRYRTGDVRATRLLDDIAAWFDQFRAKASAKTAPARVAVAQRRLESAMFDIVASGNVGAVLLALGEAEHALARSPTFTAKAFLTPVPRLPATWAAAVTDGTIEQRLAAALAARPGMRGRLVPLERSGRSYSRSDLGCVFGDRPLVDNLHALLRRQDIEAQQRETAPGASSDSRCSLEDIAYFIDGCTDDALIERWLRAFVFVDDMPSPPTSGTSLLPPATFAALALVHGREIRGVVLPRTPGLLASACGGDAAVATARAIRRLHAAGFPMPVDAIVEPPARTRRIAAALAFPLTRGQRRVLEATIVSAAPSTAYPSTDSFQEQA